MVIAFFLLIVAAGPRVCAQQVSPAPPGPAAGPVYNDVAYGVVGGQTLLLDIFEPANNSGKPRPAVVLVHGGGWISFDKSTMMRLAQFLALAGFVAVPVDYRLFQDDATRWPAQLDDVQRAVRWLRANSAKYNIDPQRIGAYGHSAGAQLALLLGMLETRDNSDASLAKYSSKVQAVVDASGPTDFTVHVSDDDTKFLASFFGADFAAHPEIWREASPIFHVAKSDAPILIIHGTRDESVPIAQAEAAERCAAKGGRHGAVLATRQRSHVPRPGFPPPAGAGDASFLRALPRSCAIIPKLHSAATFGLICWRVRWRAVNQYFSG